MQSTIESLEIHGVPEYVACWSAAGIRGFLAAILERWQRSGATPPARFALVICPLVEVLARGGLPDHVIERTTPRLRFHHFTGCHKPFVVLIHDGGDAEAWCHEVQEELAWSESYSAEFREGMLRLQFIDAIEEPEDEGE